MIPDCVLSPSPHRLSSAGKVVFHVNVQWHWWFFKHWTWKQGRWCHRLVKRTWTFPVFQPKPGVFVSSQTFRCVLISSQWKKTLGIQGFRNRNPMFKKSNDTSLCKGVCLPSSTSESQFSLGFFVSEPGVLSAPSRRCQWQTEVRLAEGLEAHRRHRYYCWFNHHSGGGLQAGPPGFRCQLCQSLMVVNLARSLSFRELVSFVS